MARVINPGAADADSGWAPYLEPGERIVWQGRPAAGIRLTAAGLAQSAFGLFFFGFSVFWITAAASGASQAADKGNGAFGLFPLFGVPFVAVGFYLLIGHWFWDAWQRRHSRYALTNRRAIIARSGFGRALTSHRITKDTPLTFVEHRPGEVSIIYDRRESRGQRGTVSVTPVGFRHALAGPDLFARFSELQRQDA